jgi:nucleotide-binding universal stress UspA family protein
MSESVRLLVAISGAEDPKLVELVGRMVGVPGRALEVTILHVVDDSQRQLAGLDIERRHSLWPGRAQGQAEHRLEEADEAEAAALLAAWQGRFQTAMPGTGAIATLVRHGRPEQEIVAAAAHLSADAIVLSARPGVGPTEPGPRSVGHVARFVLDHSPVPVLLVRGSVPGLLSS